ncbi:hypothetical protein BG011_001327 [Mortierella polycephala]|uniref:HCP-like protein n=1 Tax=Mortierella polycephala TaxID=41804 RepID=A0A9P6Q5H2_9FUNG|nr:hypothetical protein BG011_001327 [Mortierella polycephala]
MGSAQLMDENSKPSSNASNDTNKRYDQTQYQQPRQQSMQKAHYGGGVPRQTPVVRNHGDLQSQGQHAQGHGASQGQGQGQGHRQGHGALKPTPSSDLAIPLQELKLYMSSMTSLNNSSNSDEQQHRPPQPPAAISITNAHIPRRGSSSSSPISPVSADKPALVTTIPSSSLFLSFDAGSDQDRSQDHEQHRQQALQYQQKLQQKPPRKQSEDDDTDEDSDSGSMLSYRRSIQRLSMSYNGRSGVPNINLFAPSQRPHMVQNDRPGSGSHELSASQMMVKEQREERLRQQQEKDRQHQWQQQQYLDGVGSPDMGSSRIGGTNDGNYESNPSLATIDYHQNSLGANQQQQHDGRPQVLRANTENNIPPQRVRDFQVPERSMSADHLMSPNGGDQPHRQHNPGYQNHQPFSAIRSRQEPPRPSHESSQSQHSQYLRTTGGGSGVPHPGRSKSPGPGSNGAHSQLPFRHGGESHHPLPASSSRGPGAPGGGFGSLNMHPAHHLPNGGYVRPEEAVGPSNPMPEKAEDYVRQGIEYHELGDITKATHYFRTAAEIGDPVGMLMYGLSVRHGWGCSANRTLAFQYLQKSAEHAVGDLNSRDSFASTAAKGELVLAIYELGICFRHGWGVEKNKRTAAYYFEIAANLGDPDAQNDLAWCYYHGVGVKKDMYKSAKYYRLAAAQGLGIIGNSWIWKEKYGGPTSPTAQEKGDLHHHTLRS